MWFGKEMKTIPTKYTGGESICLWCVKYVFGRCQSGGESNRVYGAVYECARFAAKTGAAMVRVERRGRTESEGE